MLLTDTHSDTLYEMGYRGNINPVITPAKLKAGGVSLQTFALWTGRDGNRGNYREIVEKEMSAVPSLLAAGLRQVYDPSEAKEGEQCFMLSIEGGEVFEDGLETVDSWFRKGVRMAALTWNNENALGYSAKSGDSHGLKPYGLQVVKEMQRLKIAVDTSHLNEAGFYDLFSKSDHVPMASHSCCKSLCSHCRNLTDDQLRLLIHEDGFIGVNFYPYFLSDDGRADLETIVRHIDHICQMGGDHNVGFGSDFDGIEVMPEGLRGPQDFPALVEKLTQQGYTPEAVENIAGKNLLRYFASL